MDLFSQAEHDELAQSLTALKMDTIWVRENLADTPHAVPPKLTDMLAMLDGCVAATRRIAADLRPLLLDDLGLAPAIEWVTQNFTQRTGVPCTLTMVDDLALDEPYATAVFRMVQESLANVGKHAQARAVEVSVAQTASAVILRIADDGLGFDLKSARKPLSLGLVGLRERAQLLQGTVSIHSAPGQGTQVEAHIPIDVGRSTH